jgi:hypothetical protein
VGLSATVQWTWGKICVSSCSWSIEAQCSYGSSAAHTYPPFLQIQQERGAYRQAKHFWKKPRPTIGPCWHNVASQTTLKCPYVWCMKSEMSSRSALFFVNTPRGFSLNTLCYSSDSTFNSTGALVAHRRVVRPLREGGESSSQFFHIFVWRKVNKMNDQISWYFDVEKQSIIHNNSNIHSNIYIYIHTHHLPVPALSSSSAAAVVWGLNLLVYAALSY